MVNLEKIRTFFEQDRYAMHTGIEIFDVGDGEARCGFSIGPGHKNAGNAVQGGAIFTLADFAFAVAANAQGKLTVSVNNTISFLKPAKGKELVATAKRISASQRICFYEVTVTDELGTLVATMSVTGYIKEIPLEF